MVKAIIFLFLLVCVFIPVAVWFRIKFPFKHGSE